MDEADGAYRSYRHHRLAQVPPELSALLRTLAPLALVSFGLLAVFDLARHLVLALILLAAAFAALPLAARRFETVRWHRPGAALLLGAVLLRLPLLFIPPTLSGDVQRYLWDGRVAAAGENPYVLAPAAPALATLRDAAWPPPHAEIPTIYPPLALGAFSIAAHLPFPPLSWKLLATAADLGACALLLGVARRLGLPAGRVVWYAWNPLVVLETAGMGHVDALGVAPAIAAVLLIVGCRRSGEPLSRGRTVAAALLAGAGALAKLGPLAALPMWSGQSGRRLLFFAVALAVAAAGLLPVAAATGGIPPGLVRYGLTWEFNGPLFEPLWRLLDRAGAAPALAERVDALKEWTGDYRSWNWIYPYLYPQLLAKLVLAGASLGALVSSFAERDPVAGSGRLFGRLLLFSATLYPWYLLWVLPWAALARHRAWLALSALSLLSYLVQPLGWPLMPWIYLAVWVPFFTLLALETRRRRWSIA